VCAKKSQGSNYMGRGHNKPRRLDCRRWWRAGGAPATIRGVARNLICVGINCTISKLSWAKETKQPHKKFKVDWFGGIYTDIPPSLRPWPPCSPLWRPWRKCYHSSSPPPFSLSVIHFIFLSLPTPIDFGALWAWKRIWKQAREKVDITYITLTPAKSWKHFPYF